MFDGLSNRLGVIFDRLKGRGALNEGDVNEAMREIRIALLEADVALPVVKQVIQDIKEKAVGQEVLKSITPGQMVVKIVNDHLIQLLGGEASPINLNAPAPVVMMVVGLQGSGKTTSVAKLAKYLAQKERKKVLMASVDVYRPAAQEQLEILAQQNSLLSLPIVADQKPVDIVRRAYDQAKKSAVDVLIIDTAGRLHIDEQLMNELKAIYASMPITEVLLVADAMTGQDAVTMAKAFDECIELTGVILTRVDGDARGGAALSMKVVTGRPIKFVGLGEKVDQLDVFHPDRIVSRILGMGDVVSLVEKAAEMIDQEEAEQLAKKMSKGQFDLNDLAKQLQQVSKMGGLSGLINFLPGISKFQDKIKESGIDDRMVARQLALIRSMTPQERRNPKLLNASRKRRIASGAGMLVQDLNRLLKQFQDMATLMKKMGGMGKGKGFLKNGLNNLLFR
ncbi:MAG: signal recognition particle protein [Alphaproteobacteria bacterium]|nr:signal recognition particle protein [Alphaproteobacteria bacterium]OJV45374.1 MAG: signal recognition particle protein [Alphaproteobacteria bacterium 43-37]